MLSGKTSYRQISWSLEAARLDIIIIVSLRNLTGNFEKPKPESRGFETLRDRTAIRFVNRGPGFSNGTRAPASEAALYYDKLQPSVSQFFIDFMSGCFLIAVYMIVYIALFLHYALYRKQCTPLCTLESSYFVIIPAVYNHHYKFFTLGILSCKYFNFRNVVECCYRWY